MKITELKIMRGPNYWSVDQHRLIVMTIDLQELRNGPLSDYGELYERLRKLLPSLHASRCPVDGPAEVCGSVSEATLLASAIARVAIELQQLAGMDCSFGFVRPVKQQNQFRIVYCYTLEEAGVAAGEAAIALVETVMAGRPAKKTLEQVREYLSELSEDGAAGPSTQSIMDEAAKRNIPAIRLDENSLIMLGLGEHRKLFQATVMGTTSSIAVDTVGSKPMTKRLLNDNAIPVPEGVVVYSRKELLEQIDRFPFPWVIKPVDGNHGRGITANITNRQAALKAMRVAARISRGVIIERYVEGDDYRFLVINYKLAAAAKRTPAMVTGDGVSTIKQLVDEVNKDPNRGLGHEKVLTTIDIDRHTRELLREQGLTPQSVPPAGKNVPLKRTANISTGGTSTNVTDHVHPDNVFMAERIARLFELDVCGIDIMAADITQPLSEANGAVIEVNAGPGFRMHTHPSHGEPINVAKPVIDMLFPEGVTGRIPIVGVTGTNGKTTTARLIAHIAAHAGRITGYTTTEGVYIDGRLIVKGDCSGPKSARMVLADPWVNYAVLECARGGILRSGLAFDQCSISIVTNIAEDHLGLGGIDTMEEYAKVKEVLPQSTAEDGYAILNADDERVYAMKDRLRCHVVLFSMSPESTAIAQHCAAGGAAVTIENGDYVVYEGPRKTIVAAVNDVPLTFGGTAGFMVQNILPALAAAWFSGFEPETIRAALLSFTPSAELTPGRMNLYEIGDRKLLLDYAHNAAGYREIGKFMSSVKASRKIGIIAGTGDRRDEAIRELGSCAAEIFDELIIRHDKDGRGRSHEALTQLLTEGIRTVKPEMPVRIISDEYEAVEYALKHAQPGAIIFLSADSVWKSIEIVEEIRDRLTTG